MRLQTVVDVRVAEHDKEQASARGAGRVDMLHGGLLDPEAGDRSTVRWQLPGREQVPERGGL